MLDAHARALAEGDAAAVVAADHADKDLRRRPELVRPTRVGRAAPAGVGEHRDAAGHRRGVRTLDADGRLPAVHIDLLVVGGEAYDDEVPVPAVSAVPAMSAASERPGWLGRLLGRK